VGRGPFGFLFQAFLGIQAFLELAALNTLGETATPHLHQVTLQLGVLGRVQPTGVQDLEHHHVVVSVCLNLLLVLLQHQFLGLLLCTH